MAAMKRAQALNDVNDLESRLYDANRRLTGALADAAGLEQVVENANATAEAVHERADETPPAPGTNQQEPVLAQPTPGATSYACVPPAPAGVRRSGAPRPSSRARKRKRCVAFSGEAT